MILSFSASAIKLETKFFSSLFSIYYLVTYIVVIYFELYYLDRYLFASEINEERPFFLKVNVNWTFLL